MSVSSSPFRAGFVLKLAALLVVTGASAISATAPAPASDALQADGPALLRQWRPPVYPAAPLKARQSGMVTVRFIVDDAGHVTSARPMDDADAAFVEAALTAVKSWTFTPAIEKGAPVACCLETLVAFSPAVGQRKPTPDNLPPQDQGFSLAPRSAPQPTVTPEGNYPDILTERKFGGVVQFAGTVTADGHLAHPQIVAASHVDFVLPALKALEEWEFKPGMQGDLAVIAPVDGRMSFTSIASKPDEIYLANGLASVDGTAADVTPDLIVVTDPVWPIDALLKGEGGSATVDFKVNETGTVSEVHVREATNADFGAALVAATETWLFDRPINNGRAVSITLSRKAEFPAIGAEGDENNPVVRLVRASRRGEVGGAKGLDGKLTPLYRVRPEYPKSLKSTGTPAGHAEIEFIVDRTGRARLLRVTAASQPEFGWAAATAVSQWIFQPPHRGGQAVDVKVKIPISFAPPAN
jgi:TonB family protein